MVDDGGTKMAKDDFRNGFFFLYIKENVCKLSDHVMWCLHTMAQLAHILSPFPLFSFVCFINYYLLFI